jgi:uncharacterized membrane protein
MTGYAAKLEQDIDRWAASGLIDAATATRLREDARRNGRSSISLGTVLAVMAAVLVGAAILITIAANFEAIPRIVRVLGLFAIIAASYVGGAVLQSLGRKAAGEALYIIGAAAFGASIALIGQMYHMSGDEAQAILVWCLATMVAALLLRSPMLTNACIPLAVAWLLFAFDWGRLDHGPSYWFLILVAAIWLVSYWTGSRAARHLVILSVIFYAVLYGIGDDAVAVGVLLASVSAALFVGAWLFPEAVERFARLGGPQPILPLIGFLFGIGMLQVQFSDTFGPMLALALFAFAGIVAALLLRGRESRLMRWTAYIAFTAELVLVYVVMVGTMMETGALFMFSGFALAAVAFIISRIERRIAEGRQT